MAEYYEEVEYIEKLKKKLICPKCNANDRTKCDCWTWEEKNIYRGIKRKIDSWEIKNVPGSGDCIVMMANKFIFDNQAEITKEEMKRAYDTIKEVKNRSLMFYGSGLKLNDEQKKFNINELNYLKEIIEKIIIINKQYNKYEATILDNNLSDDNSSFIEFKGKNEEDILNLLDEKIRKYEPFYGQITTSSPMFYHDINQYLILIKTYYKTFNLFKEEFKLCNTLVNM
jgi:DNA-directed RNA polymerase beta' subunit